MARRFEKDETNNNEETTMGEASKESANVTIAMKQMNDWLDVYTIGNNQVKRDEEEPKI